MQQRLILPLLLAEESGEDGTDSQISLERRQIISQRLLGRRCLSRRHRRTLCLQGSSGIRIAYWTARVSGISNASHSSAHAVAMVA